MKKILSILAALLVLSLTSCIGNEYVKADRDTFDALAPAHRAYVESDTKLSEEQKDRRYRLLESWKVRIEKAEK